MRAIYTSSLFRFLASSLPCVALAACGSPAPDTDAAIVSDGGTDAATLDVGAPDTNPRVDAGPTPLCTGTGCNIVGIELMAATSCIMRENGQIDCWGRGQDGELGDGARRHSDNCRLLAGEADTDCSRDAVTVALAGTPSAMVSRGSIQMCALVDVANEVWCWGAQTYRLGSNLEHQRFAPEHVLIGSDAVADGARSLAVSFSNLCWVAADGTARCIGSGGSGRLGNNSFDDTATPVTVLTPDGTAPLSGLLEIDTAGGHTCARSATALYCWGNNHYGQIGSSDTHSTCVATPTVYDCSTLPVEVTSIDATHVVDIQLGVDFSCVLLDDGRVQCWGGGQSGGLGNGTIDTSVVPVEPTGLGVVDELRVVDGNVCALLHDGTVSCWGPADLGQIGDGAMHHAAVPCVNSDGAPYDCQLTPSQVMGITGATHIGVGEGHACAVLSSGDVYCWGNSLRYQLGNEMRMMPAFSPVRVVALGT